MTIHQCNAYCDGSIHTDVMYADTEDLADVGFALSHLATARGDTFIDARPAREALPCQDYVELGDAATVNVAPDGTVTQCSAVLVVPHAYLMRYTASTAIQVRHDDAAPTDAVPKSSPWRRMLRWFQRS